MNSSEGLTIEAAAISKRYNRRWIIRNLSFTFTPGVYAITGPNGSGKSTLMQLLWGQLPVSSGTVVFRDGDHQIPTESLHKIISIAAPYMDLIEEFTLREHLHFHFSIKHRASTLPADQMAERLQLSAELDKRISDFSSGMKQRLKIGLALFSEARAIFLDEPTTNLDLAAKEWYRSLLREFTGDAIVLIASNNEDEYPADAKRVHLPDFKKA